MTKIYTFATKTLCILKQHGGNPDKTLPRETTQIHLSKSKSPQALQRRLCPAFAVKWCLVTAKDRLFHQAQPALTWLDGIHVHRSFKSEFSDSLSPVELISILQILLQMFKANWLKQICNIVKFGLKLLKLPRSLNIWRTISRFPLEPFASKLNEIYCSNDEMPSS